MRGLGCRRWVDDSRRNRGWSELTEFVLDCSVTMAWLFRDEATDSSESALSALEAGAVAHVPTLWSLEVSNVLLVGERRRRISTAQTNGFLESLHGFDIRIDGLTTTHAMRTTLSLARQYGLSVYDGFYLEFAHRSGVPLATLDKKLRSAAELNGAALWRQDPSGRWEDAEPRGPARRPRKRLGMGSGLLE